MRWTIQHLIHNKKSILWLVPVSLVPAIIFLLYLYLKPGIITKKPIKGPIIEAVYGIGTITSEHIYNLKIGIITEIAKLYIREGDYVKKEDRLLRIPGIPDFRAPFSGMITSVRFYEGEPVFPQLPILTLVDTKNLYLSVILEQEAALRVKPGQNARFTFESLRAKKFQGKIRSVYPSEGQFRVYIEMENLPPEILPGMTADVSIEVSRRENVMLIPVASVHSGKVILYRDGKKKKVDVEIGSIDADRAEVLSGDVRMDDDILIQ